MKRPLEGVLLASDMDGTLIASDYTIPRRNLEAIERFKEKGGRFTVASGRSMVTGRRFLTQAAPNAPCILFNGALLYDYREHKTIREQCLGESVRSVVQSIMKAFPSPGVQAFCGKEVYLLNSAERVRRQIQKDALDVISTDLAAVPMERCHKFLFSDDPPVITALKAFTTAIEHDKIYFVQSSSYYLELMQAGVNKGAGLLTLGKYLGIDRQHTYAIGDYYNDTAMLEMAHLSACPDDAPDDIKRKADLTVGHCDNGAVADFIEYIEGVYST